MKTPTYTVEDTILDVLQRTGPCRLDNVAQQLLHQDWSEVFAAANRMSQEGRIILRHDPESSGYHLSLPLSHPVYAIRIISIPVRFCVGCGYLCDEMLPEAGLAQWMDARQYLAKYHLYWNVLVRIEDACPHCARALACGYHRSKDPDISAGLP